MGMATYPMKDVGFYVDHEVAAYIMLAADQATGEVPNEISALLEDGAFAVRAKEGALPCDYSNPSEACRGFRSLQAVGHGLPPGQRWDSLPIPENFRSERRPEKQAAYGSCRKLQQSGNHAVEDEEGRKKTNMEGGYSRPELLRSL